LYKLALSTMSLEISKISFQILRPSENRWYAEFVRNTSNRLRPGPKRVWADKVGRPGIPKAQWRMLTKKAQPVMHSSGCLILRRILDVGITLRESSQSRDIGRFTGSRYSP
jgi:hypothetical protein